MGDVPHQQDVEKRLEKVHAYTTEEDELFVLTNYEKFKAGDRLEDLSVNQNVTVARRKRRGDNYEGGQGRILKVYEGGAYYDIWMVEGKQRRVDRMFLLPNASDLEDHKDKRRSTEGRCTGCGSFSHECRCTEGALYERRPWQAPPEAHLSLAKERKPGSVEQTVSQPQSTSFLTKKRPAAVRVDQNHELKRKPIEGESGSKPIEIGKTHIFKEFADGCYKGLVDNAFSEHNPETGEDEIVYHVTYEDGDGEDLEEAEVLRWMARGGEGRKGEAPGPPLPPPPLPPSSPPPLPGGSGADSAGREQGDGRAAAAAAAATESVTDTSQRTFEDGASGEEQTVILPPEDSGQACQKSSAAPSGVNHTEQQSWNSPAAKPAGQALPTTNAAGAAPAAPILPTPLPISEAHGASSLAGGRQPPSPAPPAAAAAALRGGQGPGEESSGDSEVEFGAAPLPGGRGEGPADATGANAPPPPPPDGGERPGGGGGGAAAVFAPGQLVLVAARTGVGENFHGGVGKVRRRRPDGTYDVNFILGHREFHIQARHIQAHAFEAQPRRRRGGRCPACGSFVSDCTCGHWAPAPPPPAAPGAGAAGPAAAAAAAADDPPTRPEGPGAASSDEGGARGGASRLSRRDRRRMILDSEDEESGEGEDDNGAAVSFRPIEIPDSSDEESESDQELWSSGVRLADVPGQHGSDVHSLKKRDAQKQGSRKNTQKDGTKIRRAEQNTNPPKTIYISSEKGSSSDSSSEHNSDSELENRQADYIGPREEGDTFIQREDDGTGIPFDFKFRDEVLALDGQGLVNRIKKCYDYLEKTLPDINSNIESIFKEAKTLIRAVRRQTGSSDEEMREQANEVSLKVRGVGQQFAETCGAGSSRGLEMADFCRHRLRRKHRDRAPLLKALKTQALKVEADYNNALYELRKLRREWEKCLLDYQDILGGESWGIETDTDEEMVSADDELGYLNNKSNLHSSSGPRRKRKRSNKREGARMAEFRAKFIIRSKQKHARTFASNSPNEDSFSEDDGDDETSYDESMGTMAAAPGEETNVLVVDGRPRTGRGGGHPKSRRRRIISNKPKGGARRGGGGGRGSRRFNHAEEGRDRRNRKQASVFADESDSDQEVLRIDLFGDTDPRGTVQKKVPSRFVDDGSFDEEIPSAFDLSSARRAAAAAGPLPPALRRLVGDDRGARPGDAPAWLRPPPAAAAPPPPPPPPPPLPPLLPGGAAGRRRRSWAASSSSPREGAEEGGERGRAGAAAASSSAAAAAAGRVSGCVGEKLNIPVITNDLISFEKRIWPQQADPGVMDQCVKAHGQYLLDEFLELFIECPSPLEHKGLRRPVLHQFDRRQRLQLNEPGALLRALFFGMKGDFWCSVNDCVGKVCKQLGFTLPSMWAADSEQNYPPHQDLLRFAEIVWRFLAQVVRVSLLPRQLPADDGECNSWYDPAKEYGFSVENWGLVRQLLELTPLQSKQHPTSNTGDEMASTYSQKLIARIYGLARHWPCDKDIVFDCWKRCKRYTHEPVYDFKDVSFLNAQALIDSMKNGESPACFGDSLSNLIQHSLRGYKHTNLPASVLKMPPGPQYLQMSWLKKLELTESVVLLPNFLLRLYFQQIASKKIMLKKGVDELIVYIESNLPRREADLLVPQQSSALHDLGYGILALNMVFSADIQNSCDVTSQYKAMQKLKPLFGKIMDSFVLSSENSEVPCILGTQSALLLGSLLMKQPWAYNPEGVTNGYEMTKFVLSWIEAVFSKARHVSGKIGMNSSETSSYQQMDIMRSKRATSLWNFGLGSIILWLQRVGFASHCTVHQFTLNSDSICTAVLSCIDRLWGERSFDEFQGILLFEILAKCLPSLEVMKIHRTNAFGSLKPLLSKPKADIWDDDIDEDALYHAMDNIEGLEWQHCGETVNQSMVAPTVSSMLSVMKGDLIGSIWKYQQGDTIFSLPMIQRVKSRMQQLLPYLPSCISILKAIIKQAWGLPPAFPSYTPSIWSIRTLDTIIQGILLPHHFGLVVDSQHGAGAKVQSPPDQLCNLLQLDNLGWQKECRRNFLLSAAFSLMSVKGLEPSLYSVGDGKVAKALFMVWFSAVLDPFQFLPTAGKSAGYYGEGGGGGGGGGDGGAAGAAAAAAGGRRGEGRRGASAAGGGGDGRGGLLLRATARLQSVLLCVGSSPGLTGQLAHVFSQAGDLGFDHLAVNDEPDTENEELIIYCALLFSLTKWIGSLWESRNQLCYTMELKKFIQEIMTELSSSMKRFQEFCWENWSEDNILLCQGFMAIVARFFLTNCSQVVKGPPLQSIISAIFPPLSSACVSKPSVMVLIDLHLPALFFCFSRVKFESCSSEVEKLVSLALGEDAFLRDELQINLWQEILVAFLQCPRQGKQGSHRKEWLRSHLLQEEHLLSKSSFFTRAKRWAEQSNLSKAINDMRYHFFRAWLVGENGSGIIISQLMCLVKAGCLEEVTCFFLAFYTEQPILQHQGSEHSQPNLSASRGSCEICWKTAEGPLFGNAAIQFWASIVIGASTNSNQIVADGVFANIFKVLLKLLSAQLGSEAPNKHDLISLTRRTLAYSLGVALHQAAALSPALGAAAAAAPPAARARLARCRGRLHRLRGAAAAAAGPLPPPPAVPLPAHGGTARAPRPAATRAAAAALVEELLRPALRAPGRGLFRGEGEGPGGPRPGGAGAGAAGAGAGLGDDEGGVGGVWEAVEQVLHHYHAKDTGG